MEGIGIDSLYIAVLFKKKIMDSGEIICEAIGPIVGLLMGTHFLSSHSNAYKPLFMSDINFLGKNLYIEKFLSQDTFFTNSEVYGYFDLKEITDYSKIEDIIQEYHNKYLDVVYIAYLQYHGKLVFKYKKKKL